jgi:molybdenum cofactor synthesis domain-containing protein
MSRTAGIVVIGNEILSGRIHDENAVYLVDQLRALGVEVRRVAVVPDEVDAIRDEVRRSSGEFDHVFTSGGVGPTHDDVTIPAIAAAFRIGTYRDRQLEAILHRYYQEAMTEATLRMAEVPEGAVLLGDGGGWFPVIAVRNVYIFPGVPEILRAKFETIRERFRESPFHSADLFMRADEGRLATLLVEILGRFPGIRIGSYPTFTHPDYSLRVSLESRDPAVLAAARGSLIEELGKLSIRVLPSIGAAFGKCAD